MNWFLSNQTVHSNTWRMACNSISFCWYFIFYKFFQLLLNVFVLPALTQFHQFTHTDPSSILFHPINMDGFLFGWMFSCVQFTCAIYTYAYLFMLIKFILFFRQFQFIQILHTQRIPYTHSCAHTHTNTSMHTSCCLWLPEHVSDCTTMEYKNVCCLDFLIRALLAKRNKYSHIHRTDDHRMWYETYKYQCHLPYTQTKFQC